MKIKLLMAGLLGLVSATTFAQKGELNNAKSEYDKYDVSKGQKIALLVTQANTSLASAKTSIDKASVNEKTAALPLTYALKGAIYGALATQDSIPATSAPLITTAMEAIKKAKELDTKGENKKLIDEANTYVQIYYQTLGVSQYQNHKYDLAYQSFDNFRQASNDDTTAVYYTALAASNAGINDPKYNQFAIANYNKLLTTKYSENVKIYNYLATLYMVNKDTVNALKTISEGVVKYPANAPLREQEIRISLQAGKESEIVGKIQSAITNDPKNKLLYYYEGLTYSRIGDAATEKATKTKDNAAKSALSKTATDSYAKAIDNYKKAIEIDADYFDANFNLGYTMMKPAIDAYNAANNLPSSATQKDYVAMRLKADAQFDVALPYLQKAVTLNPKYKDALTNLWTYYRGKYDPAHAADNKTKAADLKKQIDALPAVKN
jgi:tetratricopeptide (TPR) repeat protein